MVLNYILSRLDYRRKWNDDLQKYLNALNEKKPVIFCGDLNVAHNEIGERLFLSFLGFSNH